MVDTIDRTHENARYLPGIALPESLRATTDLQLAIADAGWIWSWCPRMHSPRRSG